MTNRDGEEFRERELQAALNRSRSRTSGPAELLHFVQDEAAAFCERAKEYELLLVPADSFGTPGYVRIAYCVTTEQIEKSLPAFRKLAESYA